MKIENPLIEEFLGNKNLILSFKFYTDNLHKENKGCKKVLADIRDA